MSLAPDEAAFAHWAAGYGLIRHEPITQSRVQAMVEALVLSGKCQDSQVAYARLSAADRVASAGMWLVVHMTYARKVWMDGRIMQADDFKLQPEGHTGGALNMVPAYAGYLAMNALDGFTRAWMMGQGHCVAAIDALNVIMSNLSPAHAERYGMDDAKLSRLVGDFYSYALRPDGSPESPLGSHVNAHTAGGTQEGGYLGFTELHYAHAALAGERLVAFLSDGAFEEQRGSDWSPRWWRAEDSGLVAPIMILNGRRIEQRTQIAQSGGEPWLHEHLRLNGFDPIRLDGRDPASIAWGIYTMESRLLEQSRHDGPPSHRLPYGIAETVKGFGFPGAGGNAAHNLPLPGNPALDPGARALFNEGVARLHVDPAELDDAIKVLHTHRAQSRPLERDHALATRQVALPSLPEPEWQASTGQSSPMAAIDTHFVAILEANPLLRARVGNPDELRSNRLDHTLDRLMHRVVEPEPAAVESRTGGVVTALNEEAVVCAALGNKGGINMVVTYEAFAPKMLGALRQEIIFSRHLRDADREPGWLSVPVIVTSHTWENSKNEQSHQDPTFAEVLLGEMSDTSRVVFPADSNSAMALLDSVYSSYGQVVAMVIPKRPIANRLDSIQALELARNGAVVVSGNPATAQVILAASGAYQLAVVEDAHARLLLRGIKAAVIYVAEPGRLRMARDAREAAFVVTDVQIAQWFPPQVPRVFVSHTRPEPLLGALRRIDTGPVTTRALGYINRGGTLDVDGMLFANRCTWAHVVGEVAQVLGRPLDQLLGIDERHAIAGRGDPRSVAPFPQGNGA